MIIGTGIDIIEIERVAEKLSKNNGFKEKIFSVNEIRYCESTANAMQSFAARFSAKEAFLKATGNGLTLSYGLNEIEIVNEENGNPKLLLHGNIKTIAQKNNWNRIHVSLSHSKETACAIVIIEQ